MVTTTKKPSTATAVENTAPKKAATAKAIAAKPVAAKKVVAAVAKPAAKAAATPVAKPAAKAAPASVGASKAKPKAAAKPALSADQRNNYVEVAAFYIAERRGFTLGNPADDWSAAEAEVDRLIASGHFNK
jgi:hypothetical protein